MLANPFTLLSYNNKNLAISLTNKLTPVNQIKSGILYKYFCEYLGEKDGLNAKTIVIELHYVSKSYLIDYSNYYSTCFTDYDRICKRVHFFSAKFSNKNLRKALNESDDDNNIWKSYLGYIVIKPLPSFVIGATLLKTYPNTSLKKRYFTASKKYYINFFGKHLEIESLAFQEQDKVVGACASSALWSAFHKTSDLFGSPLPSPSDITKSAKNLFQNSGRTYPNAGLDYYQIGNAIESVGLVSELRNKPFTDPGSLTSFIYAYCKMGLPVLLGMHFPGEGDHLITITGYKEERLLPFPRTRGEISLKGSKINQFYAHDDQVGPFSRLIFQSDGKILTSWLDNKNKKVVAEFVSLFIPLNHKIRLTYENIYGKISLIDFYFAKSVRLAQVEVYWDIYLSFSNEYKKDLRKNNAVDISLKYQLLTQPLPRYVWIAKCFINSECFMEYLFDATEIANADSCITANIFNPSFKQVMKLELEDSSVSKYFTKNLGDHFLDLFTKAVKDY